MANVRHKVRGPSDGKYKESRDDGSTCLSQPLERRELKRP
jgi:hypothetical protein